MIGCEEDRTRGDDAEIDGVGDSLGHFSKARSGAPPVVPVQRLKQPGVILPREMLATRQF